MLDENDKNSIRSPIVDITGQVSCLPKRDMKQADRRMHGKRS